jgi:hypothetical protein
MGMKPKPKPKPKPCAVADGEGTQGLARIGKLAGSSLATGHF